MGYFWLFFGWGENEGTRSGCVAGIRTFFIRCLVIYWTPAVAGVVCYKVCCLLDSCFRRNDERGCGKTDVDAGTTDGGCGKDLRGGGKASGRSDEQRQAFRL